MREQHLESSQGPAVAGNAWDWPVVDLARLTGVCVSYFQKAKNRVNIYKSRFYKLNISI